MDNKAHETIKTRQDKEKQMLIEQLKKTPIIQIACEKLNIGRATYYRWRSENEEFAKLTDDAIKEGNLFMNDVAESQLISAIKDKNLSAIVFWLKHHHPTYATKVEVTARLKSNDEHLTPEQEALVTKALKLAALLPQTKTEKEEENNG